MADFHKLLMDFHEFISIRPAYVREWEVRVQGRVEGGKG